MDYDLWIMIYTVEHLFIKLNYLYCLFITTKTISQEQQNNAIRQEESS